MLKQLSEEKRLSHSPIFEWFSSFRDGRECIENVSHTGRPRSMPTLETIKEVPELVTSECQFITQVLANKLNISTE